jgi:RimJ/RimL family protein N-acetyltransferase
MTWHQPLAVPAASSGAYDGHIDAPLVYPAPPLAGNGFVLRPFRADDVAADYAAIEHPSSARWLNTHSEGAPEDVVRELESEREAGRVLSFTVADADAGDDRYLGAIVLFVREHETGELAYVIAPEARGRGIAGETVQLVTAWAFAELGLARLQLRIEPENEASCAVALRAGYQHEGVLRAAHWVRGRRADISIYSRLPTDP